MRVQPDAATALQSRVCLRHLVYLKTYTYPAYSGSVVVGLFELRLRTCVKCPAIL